VSGTLLLDSEGLSQLLLKDRAMSLRLAAAQKHDMRVVICAMTIVEADHDRIHPARLAWTLSRLIVEPVSAEIARHASDLLRHVGGLHGHKYAIDAVVAATALRSLRPVTVLTSDPEDIALLCGPQVTVIKI
jgi:predicted nucleic acid-binding protein